MLGLILATMILAPTDQTLQVSKGTKLDVNNFAGDVNVKVWDRDAVRIEVNHSDREIVDIKQAEQSVTVRTAVACETCQATGAAPGSSPHQCPQCGGKMLRRCPSCSAPFSSTFAVDCESCGAQLREPELFGTKIRRR